MEKEGTGRVADVVTARTNPVSLYTYFLARYQRLRNLFVVGKKYRRHALGRFRAAKQALSEVRRYRKIMRAL